MPTLCLLLKWVASLFEALKVIRVDLTNILLKGNLVVVLLLVANSQTRRWRCDYLWCIVNLIRMLGSSYSEGGE